jgi:hypothetical protein
MTDLLPDMGQTVFFPLEGGWLFCSARLRRGSAAHARAIDGALNSNLACVYGIATVDIQVQRESRNNNCPPTLFVY